MASNWSATLAKVIGDADGIIDFTAPAATLEYAARAARPARFTSSAPRV